MKKEFLIFLLLFLVFTCQSSPEGSSGTSSTSSSEEVYPVPDKLCALTFDDGPDATLTPKVLDKLEKYNVVATFFMIGQKIGPSTKAVIDRITNMGCEIGNHSYGYDSLTGKTADEIKTSVSNTSALIEQYTGEKPKFFRPPNLATNSSVFEAIDLPFAGGILGYDWAGVSDRTASKIAQNVISQMQDGVIILLHDVQPEPHPTPEALDIIIPELKRRGYEFVTLSKLFERKGVNPNVEYKMWTKVP
ncbi:MAG: polysaccharide deacetylase family protein [Brevinematia bacterium]